MDGEVMDRADLKGLLQTLEHSHCFRRDTTIGRIFHRGKVSFRETSATDSLHVIIDGRHVAAHVDRICPLDLDPASDAHYSWAGVLAHNVTGMVADAARLLGWHPRRCSVDCDVIDIDEQSIAELVAERVAGYDENDGQAARKETEPTQVPFGLVDEAVHLLDTEAAPWSIQLEIRVAGRLDEARLRDALSRAIETHPMARARKMASRRSLRHDHWEIPATVDLDPLRVVDCPDDVALGATRAELQSRGVPLAESPPLRARLARHPDGDVLMFNVNHAAMDGFGALRVLQSVARTYAGQPDPDPTLNFAEARAFAERLTDADLPARVRRQLALAEKVRDLVVAPARVAAEGGGNDAGYAFHHVALSASQTAQLSRLQPAGTVNDVLLASLNLAIARWNGEHGKRCGRIGVLVPANLRPSPWRNDVAGNYSLPARVSTTRRSRHSPQTTLHALSRQTRRKKRAGMGTALIEVLGRSPLFPLWVKQVTVMLLPVTGNRLVDTAMLSNLGELGEPPTFGPDAGPTVEMWFSPPARMPLGLTMGTVTVAGRLHLAFRYRLRLFDGAAAHRFADTYLEELERFIEMAPAGGAR
jgi:NRPS condensation-like uncharacterized protein